MAKGRLRRGIGNQTVYLKLLDSTSTTGAGKTGLTGADVTCYAMPFRTAPQQVSTTGTTTGIGGAYSSGQFVEADATNMPGIYRYDVPNTPLDVFGAGQYGILTFTAAGTVPVDVEWQLDDMSEPTGIPASNVPMETKINMIYTLLTNTVTQEAGQAQILASDDTTPIGTSTTSDAAGTFTRGRFS